MAVQLIEGKLSLTDYLDIDIKDDKYDDTEDAVVNMDVTFSVKVDSIGMEFDVHEVKNIAFRYTGVFYEDDGDVPTEIEVVVDDSWNKSITVSTGSESDKTIKLDNVGINIELKEIQINFVY